jgi:hypothetical protein
MGINPFINRDVTASASVDESEGRFDADVTDGVTGSWNCWSSEGAQGYSTACSTIRAQRVHKATPLCAPPLDSRGGRLYFQLGGTYKISEAMVMNPIANYFSLSG